MAKRPDVVVEAVRYEDGRIRWVRAFERRGATYSDWQLLERADLAERLKNGQRVFLGRRIEHMASTFETSRQVFLAGSDAIATSKDSKSDSLEGALLF
jgi:hypothetical protein